MLHLITGGSASGKSRYAEKEAVEAFAHRSVTETGKLYYIATMFPYTFQEDGSILEEMSEETRRRIQKHRIQRKEKGFETIECYCDLTKLSFQKGDVVLLECMSNLLANEMYLPEGGLGLSQESKEEGNLLEEKVITPCLRMVQECGNVIIVSNEIFSDGQKYDLETEKYIRYLAQCNCELAKAADQVTEVVCGIPLQVKKSKEETL